jgi:predicted secreted protein
VRWTSMLAIYVLFWVLCAFLVMPFHVKTTEEVGGERIPGQADSAPHIHRPGSIALWTTIVSATLFGLFALNFHYGWIGAEALDFFHMPAR